MSGIVGVLNENGPHRLIYLSTEIYVGAKELRGVALLEMVWHWGWALRLQKPSPFPSPTLCLHVHTLSNGCGTDKGSTLLL